MGAGGAKRSTCISLAARTGYTLRRRQRWALCACVYFVSPYQVTRLPFLPLVMHRSLQRICPSCYRAGSVYSSHTAQVRIAHSQKVYITKVLAYRAGRHPQDTSAKATSKSASWELRLMNETRLLLVRETMLNYCLSYRTMINSGQIPQAIPVSRSRDYDISWRANCGTWKKIFRKSGHQKKIPWKNSFPGLIRSQF